MIGLILIVLGLVAIVYLFELDLGLYGVDCSA